MCTQHKRSMKSIILDPGVMELVLNDAKDFLGSKEWYAERGASLRLRVFAILALFDSLYAL